MRNISAQAITDAVARLCIEANTRLPQDVPVSYTHLTLPTICSV